MSNIDNTISIIKLILEACKNGEANPVRNFGDFFIEKSLGNGQQGVVLKVQNKIKKHFALKFYQPTDKDPGILQKSIARFINEVNTLASFNHKNIVKIYTGGIARWAEEKWEITEGFGDDAVISTINENELIYYVMEYIDGCDLTDIFPELARADETKKEDKCSLSFKLKHFELLIKQVSKAMIYYHERKIAHKDIKPENIRYSAGDDTFIIVDFGFAHRFDKKYKEETIERVKYIDLPSIESQDYEKNDMGQFSKMLSELLPNFVKEYQSNRYAGINAAIERGKDSNLAKRFRSMEEFYHHIKQYFIVEAGWRFQLKLDEFLTPDRFSRFDSKLRIPVSGSILLSKEIRAIIDTPEFQRLRGVRQLGPTIFVFPGANHTRFEHSLGVYALSLRYLEKLLSLAVFRDRCAPLEKSIKLIVLSSLLHDIGHYPYSHWIEEIKELPGGILLEDHEKRAEKILSEGKIKEVITDVWNIEVSEVTKLITNNSSNELINSFTNSLIDADKLDYLIRDSVHCGVNYGKGIDVERLLDSLYISEEGNALTVTEKGRSCLLSLLSTRNIMYQEIYWHKTVRACESMFKRFFFEYVRIIAEGDKLKTVGHLNELLRLSDDEFIATLLKWARRTEHQKLIEMIQPFAYGGREMIYKPAYIYFDTSSKAPGPVTRFFRQLFNCKYDEIVKKSEKLAHLLKRHIPGLDPLDILLEKTPLEDGEQYRFNKFKVYNTRTGAYDNPPGDINSLNDYLMHNRQAYIFCNPVHYEKIRKLTMDKEFLNILMGVDAVDLGNAAMHSAAHV